MPIDFEKFGEKPFVDDRWVEERIDRLELPADTDTFMNEATRRVFDSERIADDWADGGPMVSDDEWNLLQFALAFANEAQKDSEAASVGLVLEMRDDRFASNKLHLKVSSGELTHEEDPLTMAVFHDMAFFRNMVMYLEAAFGVGDADLTMPEDEWRAGVVVVGNWNLIKAVDTGSFSFTINKAQD